MRVQIFATFEAASLAAAKQIRAEREAVGENFRLGVATGSTPLGVYQVLRDWHAAGEFSLASATAWALDEYIGIPNDHPEGYRNVLLTELVNEDATGLLPEDLQTPDGAHPHPAEAADDYERRIGEGVDLQILGIGSNGHIGFNEPTGSLASRTHVGKLTEQTRRDNARFFDDDLSLVPTHCITQGLATILSSRKALLLASGEGKAEAIAQTVEGSVSAKWPASVLQHHPDVTLYLDEAAASRLQLRDFYEHEDADA